MAADRTLDKSILSPLKAFRDEVKRDAEEIVFKDFPEKILELQKLIVEADDESSPFHPSRVLASVDRTVHPANGDDMIDVKKRKLEDGVVINVVYPQHVGTNPHIQVVQEIIKTHCDEMLVFLDKLKLWINLQMPKIEDGDNFGVQIQEDVLGELHRSYASANSMRDSARTSNLSRAKICTKLIKYPNVDDYALALQEHDRRDLFSAKQNLFEIRSIYAVLMDLMHKNIAKIRAPKANNSASLY